jgi:hypothetical protein
MTNTTIGLREGINDCWEFSDEEQEEEEENDDEDVQGTARALL